MGYANPMLRRGADWFAGAAAQAGVDGVICVDVPPEETMRSARRCARAGSILSGSRLRPPTLPACHRC